MNGFRQLDWCGNITVKMIDWALWLIARSVLFTSFNCRMSCLDQGKQYKINLMSQIKKRYSCYKILRAITLSCLWILYFISSNALLNKVVLRLSITKVRTYNIHYTDLIITKNNKLRKSKIQYWSFAVIWSWTEFAA